MNKLKKHITFTNVLFVAATIVYVLNVFVVSPDTGSMARRQIEAFSASGVTLPSTLYFKVLGTWGGHVNDALGFHRHKILSGEIWRVYTVVLTHGFLLHYLMNMIALVIAGNHIEKKYGTKKTVGAFILLTAVNGFLTDFIFFDLLGNTVDMSFGASGWITVLMGMILGKCLLDRDYFENELHKGARIYLIFYFVSTTFVLMPNLFTMTVHIGGLIIGVIAEFIFRKACRDAA